MPSLPEEIWRTRDGRLIPVSLLTEEHARNALRMLLRKQRLRRLAETEDPSYDDAVINGCDIYGSLQ